MALTACLPLERTEDWQTERAQELEEESYRTHTWFVFHFGLFKKQKAKKKKNTNKQLYVQSQTETMGYEKRQKLWEMEKG